MNRDNVSDRFRDAQANASEYPSSKTLLRSRHPHEVRRIEAHYESLREIQDDLFDAEVSKIELWETGRHNGRQQSCPDQ